MIKVSNVPEGDLAWCESSPARFKQLVIEKVHLFVNQKIPGEGFICPGWYFLVRAWRGVQELLLLLLYN